MKNKTSTETIEVKTLEIPRWGRERVSLPLEKLVKPTDYFELNNVNKSNISSLLYQRGKVMKTKFTIRTFKKNPDGTSHIGVWKKFAKPSTVGKK